MTLHKARLYLEALEQYISALELDIAAMKEDMKHAEADGICKVCAHAPTAERCSEGDCFCEDCPYTKCACKSCFLAYEGFEWKGRRA